MSGSKREIILNAFQPGMAIELPMRFAGRNEAVTLLTDALLETGSCPVIHGERGLGKTSLAHQVNRIALGDVELLENLALESRSLKPDQRFVTFFLSCTDGIRNKNQLLQRLINTAVVYRSTDDLPAISKIESKKVTKHKIKLKFYEGEVAKTYEAENRLKEITKLSIEEKFQACIDDVLARENKKVLVIVDELDRVRNTAGLASFIKSVSSADVKFLLVGVAHDISNLLKDHESLERSLIPVLVEPMSEKELEAIVFLATRYLRRYEIGIGFDIGAKESLVEHADGFPWFVHILGQEAIKKTFSEQRTVVRENDIKNAVARLAKSRFSRPFEDIYLKAVGDSRPREIVLRLFSKWSDFDIPTSEIYPVAHRLDVSNPSKCVKELLKEKRGKILAKAPFRTSGMYSFTNAMFKKYVNLRGSVYIRVKEDVNEEWRNSSIPSASS